MHLFQDELENATETARFYEAQVGEIEEKVVAKDKIIRDLEQSLQVQSNLFIRSLVITEYSIPNINLLGTDLFPLKFPLYNRIFT